mgnify:CR=1 FL=1
MNHVTIARNGTDFNYDSNIVYLDTGSSGTIKNSIIFDNDNDVPTVNSEAPVTITYSDIEGDEIHDGLGNINLEEY